MNGIKQVLLLLFAFCVWTSGTCEAVEKDLGQPQRAVLDNGLVLLHQPNSSALTLAVCCFIKVSAMVETKETAGLRNLAQQTLLDLPAATGRRLEEQMALDGVQGTVQTSPDYVEAMFLGTSNQFPELLNCVRVTFSPATPDLQALSQRRNSILRNLENRRELPLALAEDMALSHLFRDTPCAWLPLGTFDVATIKPERLSDLRRMRYVPNRAVLAVSGNVSWEQCLEQTRQVLGTLLPRSVPEEPVLSERKVTPQVILYNPWQGENAAVVMAAACPGPDHEEFAAIAALNAVLGSGEGSRLFKTLREQRGLAYDISASVVPSTLCGMIEVGVTCEPKQAAEVFHIMQSEVAGLRNRPPDEAEVQRAKSYLTSNYLLGHQRNADVAHYLGLFEVLSPGWRGVNLGERLGAVTTAEVQAAAAWLQNRAVWVQMGGARP